MRIHLLMATAALALCAGSAQAEFSLHVLHINDFHSRIEPINKFDSTCTEKDAAEDGCFGGVARVKAAIDGLRDTLRAEGQNVIVLDAGDQSQGSLMFTTYRGAAEADFMAEIGFDAMAIGNHEFDNGPEGVATFLDRVKFPIISGNIDVSQNNMLKGRVQRYTVLDVGGEKVGIVSALATTRPRPPRPARR